MPLFPRLKGDARLCLFGAAAFALFGLLLLPWLIWSRSRVEQMLTWPTIEAEIIASSISSAQQNYGGTRYEHELTYRFVVAGRSYTGDRVAYGGTPPRWYNEAAARQALPTRGSKLPIRYNPRDPGDTVIHVVRTSASGENTLRWLAAVVGLGGFGVMVVAGLAWRKDKRWHAFEKKYAFRNS